MATTFKNPAAKKGGVSPEKELDALLREHGTLKRSTKHFVYDVYGEMVVKGRSESDKRATQNNLSRVRRIVMAHNQPAMN